MDYGLEVIIINKNEELSDSLSNQLKSDAIEAIRDELNCREEDIHNISVLKKGMTNRSFLFCVKGIKYIMRIPGEGTERLIDRNQEALVYKAIEGKNLCDDPVYINPENGFKITKYLNNVRACDARNNEDLKKCMRLLRNFHRQQLIVPHTFDLFSQIELYEKLWNGENSVFRDYDETKNKVFSLRSFVEEADKDWCLTHIDAVPDNFLFYETHDGKEGLQLTDWEYAGMQDPLVDVAMYCIYSLYSKKQCDQLIDIYFDEGETDKICDQLTRARIYAYISIGGLLWLNWCEYKRNLGIEFGEYFLRQYRYAKDFFKYTNDLLDEIENNR